MPQVAGVSAQKPLNNTSNAKPDVRPNLCLPFQLMNLYGYYEILLLVMFKPMKACLN